MNILEGARQTRFERSTIAVLYFEKAIRLEFGKIERLCGLFYWGLGDLVEIQYEVSE